MKTITILTALTLTAGCGAQAAAPHPAEGPTSSVEANLERLRALHLFQVGSLENQIPQQANCDGGPTRIGHACPGHEPEFAAGKAAAEERLAKFVDRAGKAAATATRGRAQSPETVEANLAALRALTIVEIGAFQVDQPEGGNCYSFYCNEANQVRASKIEALVKGP